MKSAFRKALLLTLPLVALTACVENSPEIGKDLIDKTLLFDTYTVEFPIEDIQMRRANDLSGFSDARLAIGAIRDETFGLTTRSTAFGLVPALDTLDIGTDPKFVKFSVRFAADTISTATPGQEHIFQNFYIYSLIDTLSTKESGTNRSIPHGTEIVSRGVPVYDGKGDLFFELSPAFGQRYIDALKKFGPVLACRDEDNTITIRDDGYNASNNFVIEDVYTELSGDTVIVDVIYPDGANVSSYEIGVLTFTVSKVYANVKYLKYKNGERSGQEIRVVDELLPCANNGSCQTCDPMLDCDPMAAW